MSGIYFIFSLILKLFKRKMQQGIVCQNIILCLSKIELKLNHTCNIDEDIFKIYQEKLYSHFVVDQMIIEQIGNLLISTTVKYFFGTFYF